MQDKIVKDNYNFRLGEYKKFGFSDMSKRNLAISRGIADIVDNGHVNIKIDEKNNETILKRDSFVQQLSNEVSCNKGLKTR